MQYPIVLTRRPSTKNILSYHLMRRVTTQVYFATCPKIQIPPQSHVENFMDQGYHLSPTTARDNRNILRSPCCISSKYSSAFPYVHKQQIPPLHKIQKHTNSSRVGKAVNRRYTGECRHDRGIRATRDGWDKRGEKCERNRDKKKAEKGVSPDRKKKKS